MLRCIKVSIVGTRQDQAFTQAGGVVGTNGMLLHGAFEEQWGYVSWLVDAERVQISLSMRDVSSGEPTVERDWGENSLIWGAKCGYLGTGEMERPLRRRTCGRRCESCEGRHRSARTLAHCGPGICTTIFTTKSVRSNTVYHGLLPCRCVVRLRCPPLTTRTPSIA